MTRHWPRLSPADSFAAQWLQAGSSRHFATEGFAQTVTIAIVVAGLIGLNQVAVFREQGVATAATGQSSGSYLRLEITRLPATSAAKPDCGPRVGAILGFALGQQ